MTHMTHRIMLAVGVVLLLIAGWHKIARAQIPTPLGKIERPAYAPPETPAKPSWPPSFEVTGPPSLDDRPVPRPVLRAYYIKLPPGFISCSLDPTTAEEFICGNGYWFRGDE